MNLLEGEKEKMKPKEEKIYWEGFEAGRESSLKHNIKLMEAQLEGVKEQKQLKEETKFPKAQGRSY